MKHHGSMNRIYRLVWSQAKNTWVVVAETARGRGKKAGRKLTAVALLFSPAWAQAEPTGGEVVSGVGSISQAGSTTTIQQSSTQLSLTWKGFDIAPQETVNFRQPSASAIAVNRIYDTNGTQILGRLDANGQVYLINPNGILFGRGAQVNVGGLVASTLDINDASLGSRTRSFSGNGTGSIINQGSLHAADGGYVALLGNTVSNQGAIIAKLGTVALGAGSAATLTFDGNSLVNMQVDQSTLDNLAENKQLIQADGGRVLMTAGAKDALLANVVNNSGIIEARTVENRDGVITLLGGMQAGTVNVGGRLDAGAPDGGNGGFIETSAAQVKVAEDASVSTLAAQGDNGSWLIDPTDFIIAATDGDMSGAAVGAALASGNVTIQSTAGATDANGDINVNDNVSWTANTLTLNAQRNIAINSEMNGSGTAGLALEYGQAAVAANNTAEHVVNAPVNLASTGSFSSKRGSNGTTVDHSIITKLGMEGSVSTTDLQGINGSLEGNYVLGADIDAAVTVSWNGGEGFAPIGNGVDPFAGTFDGLGHTISGLIINRPFTEYVGFFGATADPASIRNVGLVGGSVIGSSNVGGLIGTNAGKVSYSYMTGSVSGYRNVGGLVGSNRGFDYVFTFVDGRLEVGLENTSTVSNSYATGIVSGETNAGGLLGENFGMVSDSYATGSVSGVSNLGGLVGSNSDISTVDINLSSTSTVINSYATGSVTGNGNIGGLVGRHNSGTLSNNYATGNVDGGGYVGGLVGWFKNGLVSNSHATGIVDGRSYAGGLVGQQNRGSISSSYATGNVWGGSLVGGLVGQSLFGHVSKSYSTGSVSGGYIAGGLVGDLVGGMVSNSYATGSVLGVYFAGGLVGMVESGTVSDSYSTSSVNGFYSVGGLVGSNSGTINNAFWDTETSAQISSAGGTGITTAQMQTLSTFTDAGWDFDDTWIIYENHTAPLLRVFMTPLTVTANSLAKPYDGQAYSGDNSVSYSSTPDARLLGSLSYSGTSQGAINAGSYSITPAGLYSGQQGYAIEYVSGTLTINLRTINLSANRVYDGSTEIATDIFSLGNLVSGETLSLSGSASIASKDVGTQSVSLGTLALGDGSGLAANYTLLGGTHTASVTPGTLTYTANPSIRISGHTPSGLTGIIAGFIGGDTLANATSGSALWTTAANINSLPGTYDITGSGLSAQNYVFANAPENATALTLVAELPKAQLASVLSPEPLHADKPVERGNFKLNGFYSSGIASHSGQFLTIEGDGVKLPE